MRQETGSNPNSTNKKVSIQVKLGGRSFSVDNFNEHRKAKQIEFIVDTPRVTLAPCEEVSSDTAQEILRLAGKPCRANEQYVCSERQGEMVAIIAIDSEALTAITKQWGSKISFSSPLLDMRHSEESCLIVKISEDVCYLHLFNAGLQRAEALDAATPEDILFHVTEWIGNANIPIYIIGKPEVAKLLRKYYKQVICES